MRHLTLKDRYYIELQLKKKVPVAQIAKDLGFTRQAIYYEIKRGKATQRDTNLVDKKVYLSDYAQGKADELLKVHHTEKKLLPDDPYLQEITYWIREKKYSPYAARVRAGSTLSEGTIYNYVKSGYIPGLTINNLPYAKPKKKKKHKTEKRPYSRGESIESRPQEIESRTSPGHWEGDTVYSSKDDKACLLTLTERMTRQEVIVPVKDRTAGSIIKAFDELEQKMGSKGFRETFRSITFDNGMEFARWKDIERSVLTEEPRTKTYFAHAYHSWERGTNENHNKMIRRWIPKGDDIGLWSDKEIEEIQYWMNSYPRRMFGGKSADEYKKSCDVATGGCEKCTKKVVNL